MNTFSSRPWSRRSGNCNNSFNSDKSRSSPRHEGATTNFIFAGDDTGVLGEGERDSERISESDRVGGFDAGSGHDVIYVRKDNADGQSWQAGHKFVSDGGSVALGEDIESFCDLQPAHQQLDVAGFCIQEESPD